MAASTSTKAGRPQKDIRLSLTTGGGTPVTTFFEKQVSDVNYTPTTISWQGGTPDAVLEDATYVVNITFVQALDDATSFARWAFDHRGETVHIEWQPHEDADFALESDITIPHFTLGGRVGQFNESTLSCRSTEPTPVVVTP